MHFRNIYASAKGNPFRSFGAFKLQIIIRTAAACVQIGRSAPRRSIAAPIDECREPDSVQLRCRKRGERWYGNGDGHDNNDI